MKSLIFSILAFFAFICHSFAQEKKNEPDSNYQRLEKKYQRLRDSLSILHPFVPAVSSIILPHQQFEFNVFNNLLSATKYRDDNSDIKDLRARQSYFFNTIQITYGLSKSARFNVGMGIHTAVGRIDFDENSSPFKVFSTAVEGNSRQAQAIVSIDPRIRWRPLKNNYNFIIQSSVSIPTGISSSQENVLGRNQFYFLTQFLYNQPLSNRLFLFTQLSVSYGFKNEESPSIFSSPVSLYLSYLIPRKTIVFALCNYVPIFSTQNGDNLYRSTLQMGGGLQYQISPNILINGYYTNDIAGKNYPDFGTYNISFRFTIN